MNKVEKIKIKNQIEKLDSIYQKEILKIIIKNEIKYSENRNGIFLNMENLNDLTLNEITQKLEYIKEQEKTLKDVESVKDALNKDYFKNSNKEKAAYLSNEL